MHVRIVTPEGILYDHECLSVQLTSEDGAMTIMSHHAELIAALDYTAITVKTEDGKEEEFVARRGTFHMNNKTNALHIMVGHCQLRKELSLVSAKEYLALIEAKLAQGDTLSSFALEFMKGEKFVLEKQIQATE